MRCDTRSLHDSRRRRLVTRVLRASVWLTIVTCHSLLAGELGPVFRTIGVADGLPDSRAEAVVQDTSGYIWIGTQGGLVRHEGRQLRVIGSDPERPNPLPGSNIMSLLATSDGSLWAAVENSGVVQIDSDLSQRRHLLPDELGVTSMPGGNIWSMAEDCQGRIWLAFMRGGVAVFDPHTQTIERFAQDGDFGLDPAGFQMELMVDSACHVWLLQSAQLSVLAPGAERFEKVYSADSGGILLSVGEARGQIYFSESRQVYTLGPLQGAVSAEPKALLETEGMVTGLAFDPHAAELLVSSASGLYRVALDDDNALQRIRSIRGLSDGLPTDRLHSVMVDREGGLWMRLYRLGVAYLPPGTDAYARFQPVYGAQLDSPLDIDPITAVAWDEQESVFWVGGLMRDFQALAPGIESSLADEVAERLVEHLDATVMAIRRVGNFLLVATHSRVLRTEMAADAAVEILLQREQLEQGTFIFLRVRDDGRLWIGTRDVGLFLVDPENDEREHFKLTASGRTHLPDHELHDLIQGPDGNWYLVASSGIFRWHEQLGFEQLSDPGRLPISAAAWSGNVLWLAADDYLERQVLENQILKPGERHSLVRRLPPGRVYDLRVDASGAVWLIRSSGLARFDPDRGHLRHLSRRDGLASVEFQPGASLKLDDGRIAAGGRGGLVLIDPARLRRIDIAPPVHITGLQAAGRNIELGALDDQLIELPHQSNALQIDFQANSYLDPDRNRYRVRLEGWDSDWLELLGQTRHYYSRLPSGAYRFRVQAAAPDGPWNETGDTLDIVIHRPPWLSRAAMVSYVLLVLIVTAAIWRSYRNSLRRRREIAEVRHKRALAEEQRQVVARLNESLEPLDLAATIAEEIRQLTDAERVCMAYVDDALPRDLVCTEANGEMPSRETWRQRFKQADGHSALALSLKVAEQEVARVLVEAPAEGAADRHAERLGLFEQMAGQALHNVLLLQRVRDLAEHAEQASSAKSEFLATMSHEIRTPLHGVLGMIDLLHESESDPGRHDILNTLKQSGTQLQRIIDDVLDISRIEAGRVSLNPEYFDLAAMLEQVVDLHASNAARKGLDLRLRIASALPLTAFGDGDRIAQVLGNLLSNAVKFTQAGGIELTAEPGRDGWLVLIVSDSGPGISAEDRERLFKPFSQLDASITRSHSGSGLGLAISRRLVDVMGGSLDLIEACHGGSRFRVRLPVLIDELGDFSGSLTGMLADTVVCARVHPAQMRVLRRLARRWNFGLVDASSNPRPCPLLLIDPMALDDSEAERIDEWRRQAGAIAWLQSPFPTRAGPQPILPKGTHFLRWPLVESRLLGLLLDLRLLRR